MTSFLSLGVEEMNELCRRYSQHCFKKCITHYNHPDRKCLRLNQWIREFGPDVLHEHPELHYAFWRELLLAYKLERRPLPEMDV